ncbi:MAG: hypothetical protein RL367_2048 [Pseudomonadota bacterium]
MITELRRYAVRPGEMDAMHDRMQNMLLPLFVEHGIPRPFAIWEDRRGSSIFTWMLEWDSFEARQAGWLKFQPVWLAARQAREREEFVTRTDLTLISPWPDRPFGFAAGDTECETAWHPQPQIGQAAGFRAACLADDFATFRDLGATGVNACDIIFGALPQSLLLVTWPDAATRAAALVSLDQRRAPQAIATALGGDGSLRSHGLWEALDRTRYL